MDEEFVYRPLAEDGGSPRQHAISRRLDPSTLAVVELVALCDVDERRTANELPHISMSIVQHVRLADGSLVTLDMGRGVTTIRHGAEPDPLFPWRRPLDEVVEEVLAVVRADDPANPSAHPWAELAEAARRRGIEVDAASLSALPYRVVFTAEAVAAFVG